MRAAVVVVGALLVGALLGAGVALAVNAYRDPYPLWPQVYRVVQPEDLDR